MATPLIENVSDTARWVAIYRAMESERPDALFNDHLARKLAGEQGEQIVRALLGGTEGAWTIVVRTAIFDEIILHAIEKDGVDLVLNLAAGLDSRPYRLPLPPTLRWVEVDFPGIIAHKERVLANETPRCHVERIAADLSDVAARRAVFARVGTQGRRIFVLTEGLVMYLDETQMAALASDLADVPTIHAWAMDLIGPFLKRILNVAWRRQLAAGNSLFQFAPREGARFFRPYGWHIKEYRGFEEEAHRLHRAPLLAKPWYGLRRFFTASTRKMVDRWAGVAVLEQRRRDAV
jgi:methyltransferase (TIGR00027 family)